MARNFDVPPYYLSKRIAQLKALRKSLDPKKQDNSPTVLKFGPVTFKVARQFGFCFGVENAIEIAYRAILENPDKRVFLLSEMIHNPEVNRDLERRGVKFLRKTDGTQLIPFEELNAEDVVVIPAFGAPIEIKELLKQKKLDIKSYDTTCPFVEKVWKRAAELGEKGYSIILHGKRSHEETRATFSHSRISAPTLVILDIEDAQFLASYIRGERTEQDFSNRFKDSHSEGFIPSRDLSRLGVVNQTTMLATETKEISKLIRGALVTRYGEENIKTHYADTRDTLCYATYENQNSAYGLANSGADLALVVGGFNSSNTSHLVELLSKKMATYYIRNERDVLSVDEIRHFSLEEKLVVKTDNWLPSPSEQEPLTIAITSGASCPDALVDAVISRVLDFFPKSAAFDSAVSIVAQTPVLSYNEDLCED